MEDEDQVLPRVCDETKLPRHVRQPVPTLLRQLNSYAQLKEEMRDSISPHLRAVSDQAYSKALNRVLTGFGLDRKSAWQHEPEEAPAPKSSGVITFTGSPFAWLRRLFRRGK